MMSHEPMYLEANMLSPQAINKQINRIKPLYFDSCVMIRILVDFINTFIYRIE